MTRTVSYAPTVKSKKRQYYKPSLKVSTTLRQYVKSAIARMAEKKMTIASGVNVALGSVTGGTAPNALTLTPSISQGTSQNQRVGNQVRVLKCTVRGHVGILPYNALLNPRPAPILVKMWLCRYKKLNTDAIASTDAGSAFFDTGAGVTGFQANISDVEYWPNTDSWEVIQTKTFRIGSASGTNSVPSTNATYFDNAPSVVPFEFECGSRIGLCLFNDTTNAPTNKNMFLIIQPVQADGSATTNLVPAELHYAYKCEYIDV